LFLPTALLTIIQSPSGFKIARSETLNYIGQWHSGKIVKYYGICILENIGLSHHNANSFEKELENEIIM
jgi:hypothetical protein